MIACRNSKSKILSIPNLLVSDCPQNSLSQLLKSIICNILSCESIPVAAIDADDLGFLIPNINEVDSALPQLSLFQLSMLNENLCKIVKTVPMKSPTFVTIMLMHIPSFESFIFRGLYCYCLPLPSVCCVNYRKALMILMTRR